MENVKFDEDENNVYINITLNKRELVLLKELHGRLGINDYFDDLTQFLKESTNHFHKSYYEKNPKYDF